MGYVFSNVFLGEYFDSNGYYNGKPYFTLINGVIWYDSVSSLWVWSTLLGGGTILDTLDNGGLSYPYCCDINTYPYYWSNINAPSDYITFVTIGACA